MTYRIIHKMLHLTCLASNFLSLSHSHLAQGQSSKDLEIFCQLTVQKPEDFVRPVLSSTYQEKSYKDYLGVAFILLIDLEL